VGKLIGVLLFASASVIATAAAQPYPSKPVRMVTVEAGGSTDFVARLIAQGVSENLGRPFVIDNRGGASGLIAKETVARASPDGYTLLTDSSAIWILPLMRTVSYDVFRDFAPVTLADRSPGVLVVHPSLAVNSVRELIALAKAKPGALNYSTGLPGSSNHLAAELFKALAGVDIARVNYKGAGPALTALIGGETQLMFATAGSVAPQLKSGRIRALAVTGLQRSALAPELPTVAQAGLPGYRSESTHAVFAPARTPAAVIARLQREIARTLARAEVKERLLQAGIEVVGSTPDELTAAMRGETAELERVIRAAGIRID
jgi:tripartite-type tricarboxylate transporter receptor subunit TctC